MTLYCRLCSTGDGWKIIMANHDTEVETNDLRTYCSTPYGFPCVGPGQVSKLMLAVQSCVYGSEDGVLTADMLKRVVAQKTSEHGTKAEMRAGCDL